MSDHTGPVSVRLPATAATPTTHATAAHHLCCGRQKGGLGVHAASAVVGVKTGATASLHATAFALPPFASVLSSFALVGLGNVLAFDPFAIDVVVLVGVHAQLHAGATFEVDEGETSQFSGVGIRLQHDFLHRTILGEVSLQHLRACAFLRQTPNEELGLIDGSLGRGRTLYHWLRLGPFALDRVAVIALKHHLYGIFALEGEEREAHGVSVGSHLHLTLLEASVLCEVRFHNLFGEALLQPSHEDLLFHDMALLTTLSTALTLATTALSLASHHSTTHAHAAHTHAHATHTSEHSVNSHVACGRCLIAEAFFT